MIFSISMTELKYFIAFAIGVASYHLYILAAELYRIRRMKQIADVPMVDIDIRQFGSLTMRRTMRRTTRRTMHDIAPTYTYADDRVIEWFRQYGPILEAAAGYGWLAQRLRGSGIDTIAFDIREHTEPYAHVLQGENGTFEDRYPDRALLLCHAFEAESSVKAYTGNVVVICGYRFQELWYLGIEKSYAHQSQAEYDFRPSHEFMIEHNFVKEDEIECIDPGRAGVTQVFRSYRRKDTIGVANQ